MFTMIFVNDLAGAPKEVVPWWMRHFKEDGNGMTFVDLVFPGFLFIVGMSIPFALGSRIKKSEPIWRTILHVVLRTVSLLFIGIMMVNDEAPDSQQLGWSSTLWSALMYFSAILAFCSVSPPGSAGPKAQHSGDHEIVSIVLRSLGFIGLVALAFAFAGQKGQRIITLSPFSIHTDWYGILGLIGWAYLIGSMAFLIFRRNRMALLACAVLLMCLYPADKKGAFDNFWLNGIVGIGETLGSQAAITTLGILLASILLGADLLTVRSRIRFTLLFIAGCSAGALLLHGLYGINKNDATPSWCLWACAITAALWLGFYLVCDVRPIPFIGRPLSLAGQNVLLAYLLHNLLYPVLDLTHLGDFYSNLADHGLGSALGRSIGCAAVILSLSTLLNRMGFRLRL
jgi:predicted acyltransferase